MDESKTDTSPTPPRCTCVTNAFGDLPPEMRPTAARRKSSLRKVTCPGCGLGYWTNRETDLCMDCEKQGVEGETT